MATATDLIAPVPASVVERATVAEPGAGAVADLGDEAGGTVVGIVPAAGGAGGTSLAAATATLGARRFSTVLVDLDPLGVGIEKVLGYSGDVVTRWGTLGASALNARRFAEALPLHDGVRIVGFGGGAPIPPEPAAIDSVLAVCARSFALTVLDLPRHPPVLTQVARSCDLLVVCSPQSLSAAWAAQRLVAALSTATDTGLVTRVGPGNVKASEIAKVLNLPLLIQVGNQRGLDEVLSMSAGPLRSRGPGLERMAQAILERSGVRS